MALKIQNIMAVICFHKTFWEETAESLGRKPKTAEGLSTAGSLSRFSDIVEERQL